MMMKCTFNFTKTITICVLLLLMLPYGSVYATTEQLSAVAWQKKAIEYQALSRTIYRAATKQLSDVTQWWRTIHDPKANAAQKKKAALLLARWNAIPLNEQQPNDADQPLAIILDIDETILNNSPYAASRVQHQETFNEASWKTWIQSKKATAIPGAVAFTQWAESQGIAVFYVSNRQNADWQVTADNLKTQGFPLSNPERLLLIDKSRGFSKNKTSRRQWIDKRYRVIALFGDSLGDFVSTTTHQALSAYDSWWGERWYAMPNPIYGTWLDELSEACDELPSQQTPTKDIQSHQECIGEILTEDTVE